MVSVLTRETRWGVDTQDGDIAAIVLRLDEQSSVWRAAGLEGDADVNAWAVSALTSGHPDYACLSWRELFALRMRCAC